MDKGKEDIDKMNNEEIKKSIKIRLQESVRELDKTINKGKSFPKRIEVLKYKEVWDVLALHVKPFLHVKSRTCT